jgi:DNA-3-methyladenine glycosylase I
VARLPDGLARGPDGRPRCAWALSAPEYVRYHDEEWGRPSADDVGLLEKLCLEGFQAGLSWLTILRKRPAFRAAFAGFDPDRLARFGARDVARLLRDPGIVRHRGKIEAAVANARALKALREEGASFAAHVWRFAPDEASRPRKLTLRALRALTSTPESTALSKDLLRRGFRFVGPTTVYAFMQAKGLVNDHLEGCCARAEVERERRGFVVPGEGVRRKA